jgi:beta-lactamase regulating signal transducer with metallopeptidase domain
MSITGMAVGLIVLFLRRIKRLPRRYICFLWLLPLIRLCLPFGLPSKFSLLTLVARFTTKSVPVESVPEYLPKLYYTNYIMAADSYTELIPESSNTLTETSFIFKSEALEKVFSAGAVIWLVVFAAALLTMAVFYILTKSELRGVKHLRENIYVSDRIKSPALYGVFRPKIIIPPYISDESLVYVRLHENAHIRRGDNLLRLLAIATLCMHWFNPLAWVMLKRYFEDTEFACDETVLRKIGEDERKAYAAALVDCEQRKSQFAPAFAATFGGAKIKIRIENILSYKKLSAASIIAFTVLLATLTVTLLTNAG